MARETQRSPADEKRLEQYGVWVKVKPRDVTPPAVDDSFELSDLETPRSAGRSRAEPADASGGSALTAEEEELLDELETELEPAGKTARVSVPDEEPLLADTELPDIETARGGSSDLEMESADEELPELDEGLEAAPRHRAAAARGAASRTAEPAEVEVPLSEDAAEEEAFDDLAALETELATVGTKTRDASGSSAEILSRIEDELRSIRSDLNQLRSDLSGLRKTAAAASSAAERPAAATGKGGFLEEDEDESIALTGDELDNILNTAEITEESAESPAETESPGEPEAAMEEVLEAEPADGSPDSDILSFDTPEPLEVEPVAETELEAAENGLAEGEITDETLVLSDEDLLATDEKPAAVKGTEDLPADLVLEELEVDEEEKPAAARAGSADLPEIELEGIPEIEVEPAEGASASDESETIDLETLDLGEEPKVINASPELADDLTELPEAEEVLEAEELPAPAAKDDMVDVDLEALAAEAESLEADTAPSGPTVEDLEIGELETLKEDSSLGPVPDKEIEISFDSELAKDAEPVAEAEALGDAEPLEEAEALAEAEPVADAEPVEEALEAEELPEASDAEELKEPGEAPAGIPDDLKEEIRTVLKYMDHLLEALPDEKIQEFASSDYFVLYKKLFEDLGLGE